MKVPPRNGRRVNLYRLSNEFLDVLVIGGGIVGSGIARDAALRGLRTGLVDRHDFAYGTSSRSSRLLHGGLRYLEQGRIGLVREASVEKKILHRIAPHLSQPLPFVFPSFAPKGRPLWQLRAGVRIYDLLCGGRNFQPSSSLSAAEAAARLPGLRVEGLRGAVRYFDALTNDARLVIDTLRSAARDRAILLNYVRYEDATRESGWWACQLTDVLTGDRFSARSRAVVNATGPWAGGLVHSAVKLRLSKGIHIVLEHEHLPVSEAVVLTEGRRILFVIPWGRRIIVGTTDTDYAGAPEAVGVAAEDIRYVLDSVNRTFPAADLKPNDILATWAGLRPLLADPNGRPSDISRAHAIRSAEPGWWDVAGGKLTTYRLMAEETVDAIVRHLGIPTGTSRTAETPLLPPEDTAHCSGVVPVACTRELVEHQVAREWALTLEDVLVRRGGWHAYHGPEERRALAGQVAGWMAEFCGWSREEREAALQAYRQEDRASIP